MCRPSRHYVATADSYARSRRHNAAQEREAVLAQERAAAAARLEQQRLDASVRDETARRAASPAGFEYTYEFPGQDLRLRFVSTEAEGRENNARVIWHATASELVKATGAGWSTVKYPPVAEGDIVVAVNGERTAGWNLKRVSAALDAATKSAWPFQCQFSHCALRVHYRRDAALAGSVNGNGSVMRMPVATHGRKARRKNTLTRSGQQRLSQRHRRHGSPRLRYPSNYGCTR